MNMLGMALISLVAFAIGYKLISWVIDRLRGGSSTTAISSPMDNATDPPFDSTSHRPHEDPETRYARALGLTRTFTGPEIKERYRTLIASYHPDKMAHLSPELQHMAEQKTREISEAYEYFCVKYQLKR